ncbi:MAG: glycosyltransferase [Nibricoccus sp.]
MPSPAQPSRRPKILQCVTHLALGGAERVALTLSEALRNEFDFEIFAVRGLGDGKLGQDLARDVVHSGIPLHCGKRVPMKFGGVITSGFGLGRVVRQAKPDLIHLHTEIPEAAYAALITCQPGLRRIPLVRTIHNTVFWAFWPRMGRWADRKMTKTYAAGVSPSAGAALLALRQKSGAAPLPQPPVTIYNGVPEPKSSLRKPRKEDQPVRIVFGGRFEDQKGTDLLPDILAKAPAPAPGAHLTLFGSGAHEPLLRKLAQQPPAGWTIELRAPIPDFAQRLGDYDLVLMPSRYEGLGLIAVEAFLAGTPVIGTDAAGFREAFPSDYPWLAQAGDTLSFARLLKAALAEPEKWPKLAESGNALAKTKFAVSTMADGYRSLYHQALASRPCQG